MPSIPHNLHSFAHYASLYLGAIKKSPNQPSQPVRARYAREFLHDVGLTFEGPSKADIDRIGPCIYVANHSSTMDAVLICAIFEGDLRILAKDILFKAPYLGRILRLEKHILVHRGRHASDRNAQIRADIRAAIDEGASVLFFPEGTRTRTGALGPFKLGAFYNAIQVGVPIVPMVITGTFDAMPKTTWRIKPGHCTLSLLDPITDENDGEPSDETRRAQALADKARNAIEHALRAHSSEDV